MNDSLNAEHTRSAIRARLDEKPKRNYVRDAVFGAIDGTVTTFAVVSGVRGAQLPIEIALILGSANLMADGFSMAVGNYLAARADKEYHENLRRTEESHIERIPEGEREEVRQIFRRKGFRGSVLENIVAVITSDKRRWVDTMLKEEYAVTTAEFVPWKAALVIYAAFIFVGFFPLLAFVVHRIIPGATFDPFKISVLMTTLSFFVIGALKNRALGLVWWRGGLQTLFIGGAAAALAYVTGVYLSRLVS